MAFYVNVWQVRVHRRKPRPLNVNYWDGWPWLIIRSGLKTINICMLPNSHDRENLRCQSGRGDRSVCFRIYITSSGVSLSTVWRRLLCVDNLSIDLLNSLYHIWRSTFQYNTNQLFTGYCRPKRQPNANANEGVVSLCILRLLPSSNQRHALCAIV